MIGKETEMSMGVDLLMFRDFNKGGGWQQYFIFLKS